MMSSNGAMNIFAASSLQQQQQQIPGMLAGGDPAKPF
jgi:hypothetical protein